MRLELRASLVLTLLTAAIHCAAAAVFWFFLPSPAGTVAAALTVVHAMLAIRERTLLLGLSAPAYLELERDSSLVAGLRSGKSIKGQVSARRYVSRWLVVLDLGWSPMRHRTILVARDMLPARQFRNLRLWALWDALPTAARAASLAQKT